MVLTREALCLSSLNNSLQPEDPPELMRNAKR